MIQYSPNSKHMSYKSVPWLLLLITVLFTSGCGTTLEAPSGEKSITRGTTTLEQVLKLYGKPVSIEDGPDGLRRVTYHDHELVKTVPASVRNPYTFEFRNLEILIGTNAVVKDYLFSLGTQLQSGNALRTHWGNPITKDQLSQLVKGRSTREQVVALLGPPLFEGLEFDGGRGLNWMFAETVGESMRVKHFNARLDRQGILQDYKLELEDNPGN
jgi:hypothetical protein